MKQQKFNHMKTIIKIQMQGIVFNGIKNQSDSLVIHRVWKSRGQDTFTNVQILMGNKLWKDLHST